MNKKSKVSGKFGYFGGIAILAALLILPPVLLADEGQTAAESKGNGGGLGGFFSNLFSGVPAIFQELSPADVGHKPRIRPHFAFNQGFNSNARLGDDQHDAAWQARVAPGITFSVPSGKLYTEVDYTYAFVTTQGRDTKANTSTHNINALARYSLTEDTTFGVGNNLQFSEVPGEPGKTFVLETAVAQGTHHLGPKLSASVDDTFQWFRDRSSTDRTTRRHTFSDNGVGAALAYDVTSDLSVGPAFRWNIRDFKDVDSKDYWQINPSLVASYRLGPKTTLGGNFGWVFRDFDIGGHENELVWGASASHLLGRKLVWSVGYAKTVTDTFDTSFVFREKAEAVPLDNLDRDFRVLTSHRISSNVMYNFTERQGVGAYGMWQFVDGDREDNVTARPRENNEKEMEVGATYVYRFNRYISFDVLYAFGRRFSGDNNASGGRPDYTYHKATAGVSLTV